MSDARFVLPSVASWLVAVLAGATGMALTLLVTDYGELMAGLGALHGLARVAVSLSPVYLFVGFALAALTLVKDSWNLEALVRCRFNSGVAILCLSAALCATAAVLHAWVAFAAVANFD